MTKFVILGINHTFMKGALFPLQVFKVLPRISLSVSL